MGSEISWAFEAAVKPGALDDYRTLPLEISADNEASEPGQLAFEWFKTALTGFNPRYLAIMAGHAWH